MTLWLTDGDRAALIDALEFRRRSLRALARSFQRDSQPALDATAMEEACSALLHRLGAGSDNEGGARGNEDHP